LPELGAIPLHQEITSFVFELEDVQLSLAKQGAPYHFILSGTEFYRKL
jgi:hypothetical protein